MKIRMGVVFSALSLALVGCAPAPSGSDAGSDGQAPRDGSAVMEASVEPDGAMMASDGATTAPDIVGTWVYTSGSIEERLNFRGDGRFELVAKFTSSSSGCATSTSYAGTYTLAGEELMGTASTASTETTDCTDPAMNRPARDITDAAAIARGNLSGTAAVSGDRLTRTYDSSGTPTTREYQRAM